MNSRVGADIGGSWIRAALLRPGRAIKRAKHPIKQGEDPQDVLRELYRKLGLRRSDSLTVGARGVWNSVERRRLKGKLNGLAKKIRVISDLKLAWHAALDSRPGVVVVAGTGSAAYAVDGSGVSSRAGGLGPLLGDEGSGFWIGKQRLRQLGYKISLRHARSQNSLRRTAGLARTVLRDSARDAGCRRIAGQAAAILADLALEACRGLQFRGKIALSWQGGLFAHEGFRRRFLRLLDARFRPLPPTRSAEEAGSLLR